MKNIILSLNIIFMVSIMSLELAQARGGGGGGGGGHSLGGNLVFASPSQDDIDSLISNANSSAGGISTKPMGQGYELTFNYGYRISGSIFQILVRPTYFTQSTSGSGSAGSYTYQLTGYTLFPMLRIIPLENSFIKFFLQVGVGYGRLVGSISEPEASLEFAGSNFGGSMGLGAEFCFTSNHCAQLEGNFRYLPFERNKVTRAPSSSFRAGSPLTKIAGGGELEVNGSDLGSTLSGFFSSLGYTYYF